MNSEEKCETCKDKKVFDYYGTPVICADCSDGMTNGEVLEIFNKMERTNE